jgi:hypothetical protein
LNLPGGIIAGQSSTHAHPHSATALAATADDADDADDASSDDNPTILRGQYNGNQFQRNVFDQVEGYRSGRFAGVGHTLLVGGEYGRQTIDRLQYFGTAPPITLYNPVPDLPPTPGLSLNTDGRFFSQTAAFYVQDLVQLAAVEHGVPELLAQLRSVGRVAEPGHQQRGAGTGADAELRGRGEVRELRRQADLDRGGL